MKKVNAYKRPCNARLERLALPLASSLTSLHGKTARPFDAGAALQHAEAFLFHAKAGRWEQARSALANVNHYSTLLGAVPHLDGGTL